MSEVQDAGEDWKDEYDPIEDDPEIKPLIEAATREATEVLANHPAHSQRGFCHVFWSTKKEILRTKYGIEWRTPREMNPAIFYD